MFYIAATVAKRAVTSARITAHEDSYSLSSSSPKCNSQDEGSCFVCSNELWYRDMECGHILAHALNGEDTLANLMPVLPKL
jgi:5-methylcytosine-specific restriction endonuclease McrA